uniref:Brevinin-1DYe n=3 Tax=Rana TaxID=121175 RepID=BR1E_RANDY|nr:RecName: Full=Brevinin-1DYe [Rana dybowskii]
FLIGMTQGLICLITRKC